MRRRRRRLPAHEFFVDCKRKPEPNSRRDRISVPLGIADGAGTDVERVRPIRPSARSLVRIMNKYNITRPLSIGLYNVADLRYQGDVIYTRCLRADAAQRYYSGVSKIHCFRPEASTTHCHCCWCCCCLWHQLAPVDGQAMASTVLEVTCWALFASRERTRTCERCGDVMHWRCTVQQQCSASNCRLVRPATETDAVSGRTANYHPATGGQCAHPRSRQSSWVVASVPVCPRRLHLVKMRFAAQRWHFRTHG
jgi:hypothetical protein